MADIAARDKGVDHRASRHLTLRQRSVVGPTHRPLLVWRVHARRVRFARSRLARSVCARFRACRRGGHLRCERSANAAPFGSDVKIEPLALARRYPGYAAFQVLMPPAPGTAHAG